MPADPILASFDRLAEIDSTAPIVATIGASASRGAIDGASRGVAASLRALGVPPGTLVLVAAANGAGFLAALLGARRAGCVPVLADATSPKAERERVAASMSLAAAIECAETFPGPAGIAVRTTGRAPSVEPSAAYVKLTSGSSGEPSGVAVTAEALVADDAQLASTMGLRDDDRFLATLPWSHSYALSSAVLPALRRGCLLVVPQDGSPWAPLHAARALGATVFPTVPAYLDAIASLAPRAAWPATLRTVVSAGALLTPEVASRFREASGLEVHVLYGASECGGIAYDREGRAAERGTVGTPVDGVTITLERGAIVVRSAAVGSHHVPHALAALGGGAFRAADLGELTTSGELRLLGRTDTVVNVSGKKVQPREVEEVLLALPGVREAAVLGVPGGAGGREILRAVVAGDRTRLDYAAVSSWCRERLAPHKVPRSILVVDAIPRTARGKVDRAALAAWDPVPASTVE